MGPHSKVITPSIVETWFASSLELTAAMALIQTLVVAAAVAVLVVVTRRASARGLRTELNGAEAAYRGREPRDLLRRGAGGARRELHCASWRAIDAARPVGLRQDHDLARHRRPRKADRRRNPHRRRAGLFRGAAHQHPGREARPVDGVPVLRDLAAHDGVRERRLRPARAAREASSNRREGRAARSAWCRCGRLPIAAPRNCPAGSSSALHWRAPSCSSPRCCCSTSRCPISTPSCAPTCASNCATCSIGSASRRSM